MKKRKIFIGSLLVATAISLAACTGNNSADSSVSPSTPVDVPTTPQPSVPTSTPEPSTPTTPQPSAPTSTPEPSAPTEYQKVNLYVHANPNADVDPVEVTLDQFDGTTYFGMPDPELFKEPMDSYRKFAGWFIDKEYKTPFDYNNGIDAETHVYAKWEGAQKAAEFTCNVGEEGFAVGKAAEDIIQQIYTIKAGTEIRARAKKYTDADGNVISFSHSIKMNGSSACIVINFPSAGTLQLFMQNGSSTSASKLTVEKPDGSTEQIGYEAGEGKDSVQLYPYQVEAGTYTFTAASGTLDIYNAYFACNVDLSPVEDIQITSEGLTSYIEGQDYDPSKIAASVVYENKTSDIIDFASLTIDSSAVDSTKPGTYPVKISYTFDEILYGNSVSTTKEKSINVVIHELQAIELGFNATYTGKNSYNSIYINGTVQQVYAEGQAYDSKYLTVTAITKNLATNEEVEFILNSTDYTNDNEVSFAAAGVEKTITVTYQTNGKSVSNSYNVYVVTTAPSIINEVVQLKVNASYTGEVGAIIDGYNQFKTIQQALDYIEVNAETINGKDIDLQIAEGHYSEKLEINVPNLTITGAGAGKTIIEWDSLYGINDESGYLQVTDSTATVAVRQAAENCKITGVTISNWYNSTKNFQEVFGVGYGEHRALAIIIQSDKFIMDNCELLGYQDTLELMTGRQLIQNTLITGTTDFIFGTNNTTYFKGCEIRSIVTEDSYKNGGYITAFKGANKGAEDYVQYGAIFDQCKFTCEDGVYSKGMPLFDKDGQPIMNGDVQAVAADGATAIARPWGVYAAVAVINSELGAHISTTGWDGTSSRNQRYVSMSGNGPDLETIKFVEYNNTGVGAISEAVNGCKILSADEALNYSNQLVIFATENGAVTYDDSWAGAIATDSIITIVDENSNVVAQGSYYSTNVLTKDEWEDLIEQIVVPTGKTIEGYYTDASFTTAYDYSASTLTSGTKTIYIKWASAANTGSVIFNKETGEIDGWTSTASGGTTKFESTIGTINGSGTSCDKLLVDNAEYLLSPTFTAVNDATVEIIGGTSSTSNPVTILVEGLDASGNVVASATGTYNGAKTTGYVAEGENNYVSLHSDSTFVQVKITPTAPAGKNFCVLSTTIEYVLPATEHTYTFDLSKINNPNSTDKLILSTETLGQGFLKVVGESDNKYVVHRPKNNCIQNKDANLYVEFQGTGSISIAFASTGGSNNSHFSLKDSDGNYLVAANAAELTAVATLTNIYEVVGTSYVTATWTITKPGIYYIDCISAVCGRDARINAVTMIDKF